MTYLLLGNIITEEYRRTESWAASDVGNRASLMMLQVHEAFELCRIAFASGESAMGRDSVSSYESIRKNTVILEQVSHRYEALNSIIYIHGRDVMMSAPKAGLRIEAEKYSAFLDAVISDSKTSKYAAPAQDERILRVSDMPGVGLVFFRSVRIRQDTGYLLGIIHESTLERMALPGLRAYLVQDGESFILFGESEDGNTVSLNRPGDIRYSFPVGKEPGMRLVVVSRATGIAEIMNRFLWLTLAVYGIAILISSLIALPLSNHLTGAISELEQYIVSLEEPATDSGGVRGLPRLPLPPSILKKRMSLRTRSFLYFLAVCAIPFIACQTFAYLYVRGMVDGRYRGDATEQFDRACMRISDLLDSYADAIGTIAIDGHFQTDLYKHYSNKNSGSGMQMPKLPADLLDVASSGAEIYNVQVFDTAGDSLASLVSEPSADGAVLRASMERLRKVPLLKSFDVSPDHVYGKEVLRVGMEIRGVDDFRSLGFIFVDFGKLPLINAFSSFFSGRDFAAFMISDTGAVLDCAPATGLFMDFRSALSGDKAIKNATERTSLFETDSRIALARKFESSDWTAFVVLDKKAYQASRSVLSTLNLVPALVLLIVLVILSYELSGSLTEKVRALTGDVDRHFAEDGAQDGEAADRDEVSRLAHRFAALVARVNQLVDRVYKEGLALNEAQLCYKQAELKALRAQIDPHFLFNTLDTLDALIITHDDRASGLIHMLADLFRIGAENETQSVTLANELVCCLLQLT